MMTECKAPDCEEDADRDRPGRFCSTVCKHVAIRVAAERMHSGDPLEEVSEKRTAEIRRLSGKEVRLVNNKLEEVEE